VLGADIVLAPRVPPPGDVELELRRLHDFERTLSLRLRSDPARISDERLEEIVGTLDLCDADGRQIPDGFDVDAEHDLVLGYSAGSAEIVGTKPAPDGLHVSALFKNHDGQIVEPEESAIGTATTAGEPLCTAMQPAGAAAREMPMSFALLLDRSGSMRSVIGEVQSAALEFIDSLPETGECALASFAGDWSGSAQRRACRSQEFDLSSLSAGGETNLVAPLSWAFGWLGAPERAAHQKAVIIITDGAVSEEPAQARQLAERKGEALTFVYYLGQRNDAWLQSLADSYLTHTGDLAAQLADYFGVLGEAYTRQTLLDVGPCTGIADAADADRHAER
jgi:hypothetical protein